MATLELIDLHKRFGDVTAVQNINLTVADGEFLCILGPSGCGKSTALRMIAGFRRSRRRRYSDRWRFGRRAGCQSTTNGDGVSEVYAVAAYAGLR
jgi:ABC-type glutathione transport system ATPase component